MSSGGGDAGREVKEETAGLNMKKQITTQSNLWLRPRTILLRTLRRGSRVLERQIRPWISTKMRIVNIRRFTKTVHVSRPAHHPLSSSYGNAAAAISGLFTDNDSAMYDFDFYGLGGDPGGLGMGLDGARVGAGLFKPSGFYEAVGRIGNQQQGSQGSKIGLMDSNSASHDANKRQSSMEPLGMLSQLSPKKELNSNTTSNILRNKTFNPKTL
ncbi:hypothetical protein BC829DRAFT_46189 [Chytridium lagenaria]|nr:hypothetical protein BC829DRAFT_46189 [Chytridium lagenaria]